MVTPDRRRIAVERIQERFGVSERRACHVVGQHRSTQRRLKAAPSCAEAELREHLRDFARCHPRLGWRKAHVVAHREGLVTNPKRHHKAGTGGEALTTQCHHPVGGAAEFRAIPAGATDPDPDTHGEFR